MTIREILQILKTDADIVRLLKPTVDDPKMYTNECDPSGDCIIYSFVPLIHDGVRIQSRFEVDCYSSDYVRVYEILQAIQKALVTVGDNRRSGNILEVNQNGGGYLYHKEIGVHMTKAIFNISEKVRVYT